MNKYQSFLKEPYEKIVGVLENYIKSNSIILDIGCNNGNLEEAFDKKGCFVYCVDTDKNILKELEKKKFKNIEFIIFNSDANKFLDSFSKKVDVILINTTLHEINDFKNQKKYMKDLFSKFNNILNKNGIIILGDYYYPKTLLDSEVNAFIEYQKRAINHGDDREKFVLPKTIISNMENYKVEEHIDIRAVKELNRRYHLFVLRKTY